MIRDALSNIGGVGLYGVLSITLFFATFIGLVFWAFRLKKPWLSTMSRLPLEPDDSDEVEPARTNESHSHHD